MLVRALTDMLLSCGNALLDMDRPRLALWNFALAARLDSSKLEFLSSAALAASRTGDRGKAARYCERALSLNPEFAAAHEFLSKLFMHGEHYFHVLERLHGHLRPRTYIEIVLKQVLRSG